MMSRIMTIAVGAVIGYFIYQYFTRIGRGKMNGRIHRSTHDTKICGVCGGIAEWLGVDPLLIRIAWAILACGWGTGILLYFILAFVLPEE